MVLPADDKLLPVVSGNRSGPLTFHKQKVMVKITAPVLKGTTADLDIVAVMDISGSMKGTKLQLLKQAMKGLVDTLGNDDRLAVFAFNSKVVERHSKELTRMSKNKKVEFQTMLDTLEVGGGTNIKDALKRAITTLMKREDQKENRRRAACIFLMSDGEQNNGGDARTILEIPDFTVHTFGLGTRHDELVLAEIAYRSTGGVYSNVPDNMLGKFKEFMQAQLGLHRSVTALDVKVTLTPTRPVLTPTSSALKGGPPKNQVEVKEQKVGSIGVDAGDYMVTDGYTIEKEMMITNGSRVIRFGDLARDEVRRIIVDIPLHGITDPIVKPEEVLKVDCFYRLPHEMPSNPVTVSVEFVRDKGADQYEMKADLKRELVRRDQAEYLRMVKLWTENKGVDLGKARGKVEEARGAVDEYFNDIDDNKLKDEFYEELGNLDNFLVRNASDNDKKLCRAYLLACLSSHGRQRFAGRGGQDGESPLYLTPRMKKYINSAKKSP